MKLTYTAKMKMAGKLLENVGATLQADLDRLSLWIYCRPFKDSFRSDLTPRDR